MAKLNWNIVHECDDEMGIQLSGLLKLIIQNTEKIAGLMIWEIILE